MTGLREQPPKDDDGRWVSLDPLTCELFGDWARRRRQNATDLAATVSRDTYAFSPEPDGSTPWNPHTMTHRYRRYARRIGISSSLKELRHYSATELLHAGVDLNTVARRLGHAEGSTTLKFYAQFTASADQRAAAIIPSRLDTLRKQEWLRELYRQEPSTDLDGLAATLAPVVGLDHATALGMLTEFADLSLMRGLDELGTIVDTRRHAQHIQCIDDPPARHRRCPDARL